MVASRSALVAFILTATPSELNHFSRFMPENMRADDAVRLPVDDKLHDRLFAAARQCRLHRTKARAVDVDDIELRARFGFRQADGADFGRRKDRRRHELMIDRAGLAAKDMIGVGVALANGDRRQSKTVGDVADRMDIGRRRRRKFVHLDRASLVERDADRLEPEALRVGAPAGGDENLIDGQILAVGQSHMQGAVALFDARRQALEAEHHAGVAKLVAQPRAHVLVEAAQHIVGAR